VRDEVLLMRESLSHLKGEDSPEKTDHEKFLSEKGDVEGEQGQSEKK